MTTIIVMTKENYTKDGKKWVMKNAETEQIFFDTVKTIANSVGFFRRLGGVERLEKNYTSMGYVPVKLTSINPDKTVKTIRKFKYLYNEI
jgi:hypothetical protein